MATETNGIATKEDLYIAFRAFSSASTSKQCPTYAEVIAEGLVVSTTLNSNQLVKYSLISAVPSGISLSAYSWGINSSSASMNVTVTLTNATGFTVTDNATWITTSKSGNTVTITATANTSTSSRSGTVTFTVSASQAGDGVARTATLTVSQSGAAAYDPTITVYITNLQEITEYYGSNGLDGYTYFRWSDGSAIDDDDLTYDLYCFDGSYSNTVTGTLSQWENFYNSIHGEDDCCLWNTEEDVIAGPLYEGDCETLWDAIREAAYMGDSECDFEFPFDNAAPSVSPTSVSFASSGGSKVITLKNGVLTSSSESLSWITLSGASTGSTSVTITASENTTSNSRSGYVYIYVDGTSCPVYVNQSAATVTNIDIPITYSMDGWMSATNTEFDNSLSVTAYNTSTGATKNICSSVNITDGYGQNGEGDRTVNLGTLTIPESELSNWEIRVWGHPRSCSAGYANICFWDEDYRYAACPNLDMEDWGGSLNSPVLKAPLRYIEDYGGCVDIYFWSAAVGGTAPNSNQSSNIGGTSGSNSGSAYDPSCTLGLTQSGSWTASSKSSVSGYSCYQSSGSYNVNNGLDIMRINLYNFGGQTFTIYIRSYAEGNYDYTAAGALDVTLSTTNNSTNYPTGSYTSMPSSIKAWTRGNQQSGTALSNYAAVSYTIPNNSYHFIDIAYKKDSGINNGDDRGYVLIPNTYLS